MDKDVEKLQQLANAQEKTQKNKSLIIGIIAVCLLLELVFLPMGWLMKLVVMFVSAVVIVLAVSFLISGQSKKPQ